MGRHSSRERGPLVRSFIAWLIPWLVVAGIVGAAIWVAVDQVGGDEVAATDPQPTPTQTQEGIDPVVTPEPTATVEEDPEPGGEIDLTGVTAQVLNATGGVEGAGQKMADRLAQEGIDVIAIDTALGEFEVTTVYWTSAASRPFAQELAGRFGWVAERKPDNLSASVQIHVVVGRDEAG